jgi:hypothetical protein
MISYLILLLSLSAFSQFFLFYCRAVVLAYEQVEISPASRKFAGLETAPISGDEFGRILRLASLCTTPAGDRAQRIAARLYFFTVSALRLVIPSPALSSWADSQRAACAHFAAVALDRRVLATVSERR